MDQQTISLRPGTGAELETINGVIERAVMTWDLPSRVKRLALSSYRYVEGDLAVMDLMVAVEPSGGVVGVVAWEPADPRDAPDGANALLLHGLYVEPAWHGRGVGTRLLGAAEAAVRAKSMDGLLVKAQRGAEPFFMRCGLRRLAPADDQRDYANRFWKPLDDVAVTGAPLGPVPPIG